MTLDQFLKRLRRKNRRQRARWWLDTGAIRLGKGSGTHCPLSFVAGTEPCDIGTARKALGIQRLAARRIATAADIAKPDDPKTAAFRDQLLLAVGL